MKKWKKRAAKAAHASLVRLVEDWLAAEYTVRFVPCKSGVEGEVVRNKRLNRLDEATRALQQSVMLDGEDVRRAACRIRPKLVRLLRPKRKKRK